MAPAPTAAEPAILAGSWSRQVNAFVLEGRRLDTGEPSDGFQPLPLQLSGRTSGVYAYDPGRSRLALVTGTGPYCTRMSGGSACWPASESLHWIDLLRHTEMAVDLQVRGFVPVLAVRPDGNQVALARQSSGGFEVLVFSPDSGGTLRQAFVDFLPSWIGYSLDGEEVLVAGAHPGDEPGISTPGRLTSAVLDGATLELLWEEPLDLVHGSWCLEGCGQSHEQVLFAFWNPALVRIPGTDRLLIIHADSDRMTSVDFGERSTSTRQIAGRLRWIDRWMALGASPAEAKGGSRGAIRSAVASQDGRQVFAVGETIHASWNPVGSWDSWNEPMGLLVLDASNGEILETHPSDAVRVGLSPDGRWLLTAVSGPENRLEAYDPRSLEPGPSVAGWDFAAGFTTDGAGILLGVSYASAVPRYAVLDPETLEPSPPWSLAAELYLFP